MNDGWAGRDARGDDLRPARRKQAAKAHTDLLDYRTEVVRDNTVDDVKQRVRCGQLLLGLRIDLNNTPYANQENRGMLAQYCNDIEEMVRLLVFKIL